MNDLIIGIIGSAVLMTGWGYETFQAFKNQRELIDLNFAAIYLIGLTILTYYSILIQNVVFIWLNLILLILVSIEVVYTLHLHKNKRKK